MANRAPALLWWIVAFKVLKAGSLVAIGATMLATRRMPAETLLTKIALVLHVPFSSRILQRALSVAISLTPRREIVLGLTALAYGGLFAAEGMGLSRRASWARWLTLASTSCLVPLEVYEIARRPTPLRILVLLVNLGVVVYLVRKKEVFQDTP